jgi:hypothetical protein
MLWTSQGVSALSVYVNWSCLEDEIAYSVGHSEHLPAIKVVKDASAVTDWTIGPLGPMG